MNNFTELKDFYKFSFFILIVFLIHLLTINFLPTNFEGPNGIGANFFEAEDKKTFLQIFFKGQFNSFAFPLIASLLNALFSFIDGNQSIRILSASSYIFLTFAIINIYQTIFNKKINIILLLIIILNPIIWHYGHRMYVGLFSYSISLFAFSYILLIKKNFFKFILYFILGLGIVLKPFNLILLPILTIIYFNKFKLSIKFFKVNIFLYSISMLLPFIYYFIIYFYLGNLITPENEDLKIAFFSNHDDRKLLYVLNNFVSYVGFFNLMLAPFSFILIKKKEFLKNKIQILLIIFLSFFLSRYLFFTAELNFGPLQSIIPNDLFFYLISFSFFYFFTFNYYKISGLLNNSEKLYKYLLCIIFIILYIFILSFIKGSQRYIIPIIPIYFLLIHEHIKFNLIYVLSFLLYLLLNLALLLNYYITGKSYEQIINYLNRNDILYLTNPMVITPHVIHLYQNNKNLESGQSLYIEDSIYFVDYGSNQSSIFLSSVDIFGTKINKYSVFKYD